MLIKIINADNQFDFIKDDFLDPLIKSNKIRGFMRSTGWVTVGVDPMRKSRRRGIQEQANEAKSIVQVEYTDLRYDFVAGRMLDSLLESNKVSKFKRTSGWVTVGVDRLRQSKREYVNRSPIELKKRA